MIANLPKCADIRKQLQEEYSRGNFVIDKSGQRLVELIGVTFIADEPIIFGKENADYITRELKWYKSMSLNVNDIPPPIPAIWKAVATPDGRINSNYGYLLYSAGNGHQYANVYEALIADRNTRRAIAIYTRPSMHSEYKTDGMSDFICTNAVQYLIRDGHLHCHVMMRANDAVFGYKNDVAWQKYALDELTSALNAYFSAAGEQLVVPGSIIWTVSSLHVYSRHWNLLE